MIELNFHIEKMSYSSINQRLKLNNPTILKLNIILSNPIGMHLIRSEIYLEK